MSHNVGTQKTGTRRVGIYRAEGPRAGICRVGPIRLISRALGPIEGRSTELNLLGLESLALDPGDWDPEGWNARTEILRVRIVLSP